MRKAEKGTIGKARALRRNMTRAETVLWQKLRRKQLSGYRFRRQMPLGPYIADFACVEKKLIVELDGETHSSPSEQAQDQRRTLCMSEQGWRVYRVWNTDVYDNLEVFLRAFSIIWRTRAVIDWVCPLRPLGTSPVNGGGK